MLLLQKHLPFFFCITLSFLQHVPIFITFKWTVIFSESKRCPLLEGVECGNGSHINVSQAHYGILMDWRINRTWVLLGLGCSTAALLLRISWSTGLPIFYMSWVNYKESTGLDHMWKWEKVQKGGGPLPNEIGSAGKILMFNLSVLSSSPCPPHLLCYWKERSYWMSAWSYVFILWLVK